MTSKKEHQRKNSVTDISSRGIYASPYVIRLYAALPGKLGQLGSLIFCMVCDPVRYKSGAVMDGHDYISTLKPLTVDDVLVEVKSIAYAEGKKIENDRRNYKKHLMKLHDNNIFYMWTHGKYSIFIMEREMRSWLVYNKGGCVTPKTMMKIIGRARTIINSMVSAHDKAGTYVSIGDIESSFGVFINIMMDKMHHLIAADDLPRWDKDKHIYEYLEELYSNLENLEDFDGLIEADDYMARLPKYVRDNLEKINGENMKSDLANEIAPKGNKANLSKPPRKKREKKVKELADPSIPTKPKKARFDKKVSPLEDGSNFTKYYKAYIQQLNGGSFIRFDDIQADNRAAVEILDLMKEYGVCNKEFLNDWIEYFYENSLKGEKVRKAKYTSVSVFKYTFESYKERRHIPQ